MERKMIDERARQTATDLKNKETELIEILQEVDRLRIYEDYGLRSLFAYCTLRLGLSPDRTSTYIRVAKMAVEVPALKQAIEEDKLSISNAKKLAKVINSENQASWIEKGTTLSTRQLEKEIAKEKPEEKVKERLKPIAEALYELRCTLSPKAQSR